MKFEDLKFETFNGFGFCMNGSGCATGNTIRCINCNGCNQCPHYEI